MRCKKIIDCSYLKNKSILKECTRKAVANTKFCEAHQPNFLKLENKYGNKGTIIGEIEKLYFNDLNSGKYGCKNELFDLYFRRF